MLRRENKSIEEIISERIGLEDNQSLLMEVMTEVATQLILNGIDLEEVACAMFYYSMHAYLDNEEDLELAEQYMLELYKQTLKSHIGFRKMQDDRTNPEHLDFFNNFLKGDESKIH